MKKRPPGISIPVDPSAGPSSNGLEEKTAEDGGVEVKKRLGNSVTNLMIDVNPETATDESEIQGSPHRLSGRNEIAARLSLVCCEEDEEDDGDEKKEMKDFSIIGASDTFAGDAVGEERDFALKTLDAFDDLLDKGVAVEMIESGNKSSATESSSVRTPITQGIAVTVHCTAYMWDGSSSRIKAYVSTRQPDVSTLRFVVGKDAVTRGLDEGVQR
jgi:hypothetical protein